MTNCWVIYAEVYYFIRILLVRQKNDDISSIFELKACQISRSDDRYESELWSRVLDTPPRTYDHRCAEGLSLRAA